MKIRKSFHSSIIIDICIRFLVRVSYMEIYNEDVRDLLGKDQHAKLEVKQYMFMVDY